MSDNAMTSDRDQLAALLDILLGDPERDTATREFLARETATSIIEQGWRPPPRRIETPAELDSVAQGTVVISAQGTLAGRYDDTRGVVLGDERAFPWRILDLPAVIVWSPTEKAETS